MSRTARIAKNTLMLYFRQILVMLVSFYTVRVKLEILGVENYGIYNIVGSIVLIFTFINTAMTSSTQRFLNYAMGEKDKEQARNVYSMSYTIHALIALVIVILAETIGIWFFYNVLNIPLERQSAAFIAYQFSILGAVLKIFQIPNSATIIANEKMSFFAYISIAEVIMQLGIVFMLSLINYDKLIIYSVLLCAVQLIIFFIQKMYCNFNFETAHFRFCKDKNLFKKMASFSFWTTFSDFANACRNRGINILINIFYGVVVNAAMGIANQVYRSVNNFVKNFNLAYKPQIIQSYSAKDYDYFMKLIFRSSKVSFYLLYFLILPLFINAGFVLQLWLKNVPEYSVIFTQLMLLNSLEVAITTPLAYSIQATGKIKKYELFASIFVFLNLPVSLLFLWLGFSPPCVLIIKMALNVVIVIYRILYSKKMINLCIKDFLREVIIPILIVAAVSSVSTVIISRFFIDWAKLIITCIFSVLCTGCLVYFVGINRQERVLINNFVKKRFARNDKDIL